MPIAFVIINKKIMDKEDTDFWILCFYRTRVLNDEIKFLDIKNIAIDLAEQQDRTFEYIYNFLTKPLL